MALPRCHHRNDRFEIRSQRTRPQAWVKAARQPAHHIRLVAEIGNEPDKRRMPLKRAVKLLLCNWQPGYRLGCPPLRVSLQPFQIHVGGKLIEEPRSKPIVTVMIEQPV